VIQGSRRGGAVPDHGAARTKPLITRPRYSSPKTKGLLLLQTRKALSGRAFRALRRRLAANSAIRPADLPHAFATAISERAQRSCGQRSTNCRYTPMHAFRTSFAVGTATALSYCAGALVIASMLLNLCRVSAVLPLLADDPIMPLISIFMETAGVVLATVISLAAPRRSEASVWTRLEHQLAPALVRYILKESGAPELNRERREVTALFTDVEGFTAMTYRADPDALVAALSHYFEGMTAIIVAHGGMIDKIVGDAVHALFNAPIDLVDHPRKAVDCAIALRAWSETFRLRTKVAMMGFGRTRIGIETGPAIVGDVGIRARLDYTAHGDVVNVAARLEAANKELGSSICIGPVAASRCDQSLLRPLGNISVRGRDDVMAVFEPWSSSMPASGRRSERTLASPV
jgi:adenylate cyclase